MLTLSEPAAPRVWEQAIVDATLPARAKLTGLVLARHAGPDDFGTSPGIPALAVSTSQTPYRVRGGLYDLEHAGYLGTDRERPSESPFRFRLTIPIPRPPGGPDGR